MYSYLKTYMNEDRENIKITNHPQYKKITHSFIITLSIILILILLRLIAKQSTTPPPPPAQYQTPSPTRTLISGKDFVSGQVVAKFKQGVPQGDLDQKLKLYNARIIDKNEKLNISILEVPAGKEQEIID